MSKFQEQYHFAKMRDFDTAGVSVVIDKHTLRDSRLRESAVRLLLAKRRELETIMRKLEGMYSHPILTAHKLGQKVNGLKEARKLRDKARAVSCFVETPYHTVRQDGALLRPSSLRRKAEELEAEAEEAAEVLGIRPDAPFSALAAAEKRYAEELEDLNDALLEAQEDIKDDIKEIEHKLDLLWQADQKAVKAFYRTV